TGGCTNQAQPEKVMQGECIDTGGGTNVVWTSNVNCSSSGSPDFTTIAAFDGVPLTGQIFTNTNAKASVSEKRWTTPMNPNDTISSVKVRIGYKLSTPQTDWSTKQVEIDIPGGTCVLNIPAGPFGVGSGTPLTLDVTNGCVATGTDDAGN